MPGSNDEALPKAPLLINLYLIALMPEEKISCPVSGVFNGVCGLAIDHCVSTIGYEISDDGELTWHRLYSHVEFRTNEIRKCEQTYTRLLFDWAGCHCGNVPYHLSHYCVSDCILKRTTNFRIAQADTLLQGACISVCPFFSLWNYIHKPITRPLNEPPCAVTWTQKCKHY